MDNSSLIPRHKSDFERLDALIAAGPEAAIPILDKLLLGLQDINWPIAGPLARFLVTVGEPLLPHIRNILLSGDDMWIYWVLLHIVARLPADLVCELGPQLNDLTTAAENDIVALRIGVAAGVWDNKTLRFMLANKLTAYEEFISELKEIQHALPAE